MLVSVGLAVMCPQQLFPSLSLPGVVLRGWCPPLAKWEMRGSGETVPSGDCEGNCSYKHPSYEGMLVAKVSLRYSAVMMPDPSPVMFQGIIKFWGSAQALCS